MTFFSKIFGASRPKLPSTIHPHFGRIMAVQDVGDGMFFWEACEFVHERHGELTIHCDAPESGPTQAQVEQFRQIFGNLDHYWALSKGTLLERLSEYGFASQIDTLRCSGVLLATDGKMSSHWELTFEQPKNGWLYNVNFKNGVPYFVTIDS